MNDYILFMHNDAQDRAGEWDAYLERLRQADALQGGSAIGDGVCVSKSGTPVAPTSHLAGFILIQAADLDSARGLVLGNPVYEAGGTVELRELPKT